MVATALRRFWDEGTKWGGKRVVTTAIKPPGGRKVPAALLFCLLDSCASAHVQVRKER